MTIIRSSLQKCHCVRKKGLGTGESSHSGYQDFDRKYLVSNQHKSQGRDKAVLDGQDRQAIERDL